MMPTSLGRIVIINDLAEPKGGASKLAVESAMAFAGRGIPVTFVSGDEGHPALGACGVESVALGQKRLLGGSVVHNALRGIYNGAAEQMLAAWIAQNDTPGTVYHVHGWSQILTAAIFKALRPVRGRVVMTAHDFFLTCPNGAVFDYVAAEPCPRVPMSGACLVARCDRRHHGHKLWRSARHLVQGHVLSADELPPQLLIHRGMEAYFARSGLGGADMVVLPNPVKPYVDGRIAAENNREVLFVGRIEATKGIDLAAEACRQAGVTLTAVGDGALLEPLRIQYPEMKFVGRLPSDQIHREAVRARMVVMPSRHMEPFGLSAVEALWSGLPVLSAASSLIAPDIAASGAGRSIDVRDTAGFAATIAELAADDGLVREMSEAAFGNTRHLALREGEWIDALLIAYGALLSGGKAALAEAAHAWSGGAPRPDAAPASRPATAVTRPILPHHGAPQPCV